MVWLFRSRWVLCLAIGLGVGAVNAFFITRIRVVAFIVTLSILFIGRGLGLWITETRAMNLPESFLQLGAGRLLGMPFPVWLFGSVAVVGHLVLTRTPFGRQVLAVGYDVGAAQKAGVGPREFSQRCISSAVFALLWLRW